MDAIVFPLSTIADLDAALRESFSHPVMLFKHSQTCGTSAYAFEEVEEWLEGAGVRTFVVTAQTHREVSNEIARRLSVRHETPQALLVRNGEVRWHGSHYRVTAEALHKADAEKA